MEFQDQLQSDWGRSFHSPPPAEFDRSPLKMVGSPADPNGHVRMEGEPTSVRSYNNRSFATNARLRLESLKSGYNSASPRCVTGGLLDKYKHRCDGEGSQREESIFDWVELLDVEADVQDEESWLYQSSKRTFDNRSLSALGWCRHVLDNPSPESEAARRSLINRLQHCTNRNLHRCPALFHHSGSADSSMAQPSDSTAHRITDSIDSSGPSPCSGSTNSSYKLQDITDVHDVARMQEASLRHDYISAPASRRGAEPSAMSPPYFETSEETIKLNSGPTPSSSWKPGASSSNPSCHSPLSFLGSQTGCQSPKLSRLQQQVTQFKLLKLAQGQGSATVRTRSPLRTSLRSLQAARNSRSFDTDDHQPAESQITDPPSGASPETLGSRLWSSPSGVSTKPTAMLHSVRDREKRLQRSQSASPCRIPHSAKGHLSVNGRVFASPERRSAPAWARGGLSNHRGTVSRHDH